MTSADSATAAALFRAHTDAPTIAVERLGVTMRILVSTDESSGSLAAIEYCAPPAFRGPAPHFHAQMTETFIGVEGAPLVRAGDTEHVLTAGAVVVVPPGVVHAFSNPGGAPSSFIVLASPGLGLDRYFAELAAQIGASTSWPPTEPDALSALSALAARYDMFAPGA